MQGRDWTLTFLFLIFVLQFSKHFYMHRLVWSSKELCQLARHIVILAYLTAETQRLSLIWNPTPAWELTTVFLVSGLAWPSPYHTASGKMSFGSSLSDQLVSLHVIRVLVITITDEEEGQLLCLLTPSRDLLTAQAGESLCGQESGSKNLPFGKHSPALEGWGHYLRQWVLDLQTGLKVFPGQEELRWGFFLSLSLWGTASLKFFSNLSDSISADIFLKYWCIVRVFWI